LLAGSNFELVPVTTTGLVVELAGAFEVVDGLVEGGAGLGVVLGGAAAGVVVGVGEGTATGVLVAGGC
jgi:hypothetical protein